MNETQYINKLVGSVEKCRKALGWPKEDLVKRGGNALKHRVLHMGVVLYEEAKRRAQNNEDNTQVKIGELADLVARVHNELCGPDNQLKTENVETGRKPTNGMTNQIFTLMVPECMEKHLDVFPYGSLAFALRDPKKAHNEGMNISRLAESSVPLTDYVKAVVDYCSQVLQAKSKRDLEEAGSMDLTDTVKKVCEDLKITQSNRNRREGTGQGSVAVKLKRIEHIEQILGDEGLMRRLLGEMFTRQLRNEVVDKTSKMCKVPREVIVSAYRMPEVFTMTPKALETMKAQLKAEVDAKMSKSRNVSALQAQIQQQNQKIDEMHRQMGELLSALQGQQRD